MTEYSQCTQSKCDYYASAEGERPNRLIILNMKTFKPVRPCTLAKWLLRAMAEDGIDTNSYEAHCARSAAATVMLLLGLSLQQGLEGANWSPTSRTFAMFYDRSM